MNTVAVICNLIYSIIGAGAICGAIKSFKSGRYFIFGLYIMAAVGCSAGIFDIYLGG